MSVMRRYTTADLEALPDIEGVRYEIIGGELHVAKQPRWEHQYTCTAASAALQVWSDETGHGLALGAPGVIFADDDNVAPDVVWISHDRLAQIEDEGGHLGGAPELVIEVLSPGAANVQRDRDKKLALYSRRGVEEYWIVDWRFRTVDQYRRAGDSLELVATLTAEDVLTTPLLPGFRFSVARLWPPTRRRPA
jgi:Uma2 family endonuclease